MKRNLMSKLHKWKDKKDKAPLILLGARQVGKTYLLKEFAEECYEDLVYINFESRPEEKNLFKQNLDVNRIINEIELNIGKKINPSNTLIFFDEIQQEPKAITALKYFHEELAEYDIVCAGSLLGTMLLRENLSFPVGKVEIEYLFPFTFDEYLMGVENENLKSKIIECYINNTKMPLNIHEKLIGLYKRFLCIGGMPAAVNNYRENKYDLLLFDSSIHENIINAYIVDMGKYSKSSETLKIQAIYKSIPNQLARENKKFKYSTIKKGSKAAQYDGSIEWLLSSRVNLIAKGVNYIDFPLNAYYEGSAFKMYMSDVGLLNKICNIPYRIIMGREHNLFKGAITENYVATELLANKFDLFYYKSKEIEIDFVIQIGGNIIPIEVKANDHNRSRSLNYYINKHLPKYSLRISNKNFGMVNNIKSVPLYAVFCIDESLISKIKLK